MAWFLCNIQFVDLQWTRWLTVERNTSVRDPVAAAAVHAMIWTQHVRRCVWWGLELLLDSPRGWLIWANAALWLSASKPWRRATRECAARPLSTSLMCGIVATKLFYRTFFLHSCYYISEYLRRLCTMYNNLWNNLCLDLTVTPLFRSNLS